MRLRTRMNENQNINRSTRTMFLFPYFSNIIITTLLLLLLLFIQAQPIQGKGQGPIGMWAPNDRLVLVADKRLTGVVLVNLETSRAIERLYMIDIEPKGLCTCLDCDFIVIAGPDQKKKYDFWRIYLDDTIANLLAAGDSLNLENAKYEPWIVKHEDGVIHDSRMCEFSKNGKTMFVADSEGQGLWKIKMPKKNDFAINILKDDIKNEEPFGVNWSGPERDDLLVTMHKNYVWRITSKGKVLETWDMRNLGCEGLSTTDVNGRNSFNDPTDPKNSILVLVSIPKTYHAVLWRVTRTGDEIKCRRAAGKVGPTSGWQDGKGKKIVFSRPHFFIIRPNYDPPQAIISDIDNRALRLVDLTTYESSSLMYDRDNRLLEIPEEDRLSPKSCKNMHSVAKEHAIETRSVFGDKVFALEATSGGRSVNYIKARRYCADQGARLCEPVELRESGVAKDTIAWTNGECGSCWHRKQTSICEPVLENFMYDGTHGDKEFTHSWISGHAYEIGAHLDGGPATICPGKNKNFRAEAPCCWDCY